MVELKTITLMPALTQGTNECKMNSGDVDIGSTVMHQIYMGSSVLYLNG
jgi:hypothetical protein